jgi:hypothetical protein
MGNFQLWMSESNAALDTVLDAIEYPLSNIGAVFHMPYNGIGNFEYCFKGSCFCFSRLILQLWFTNTPRSNSITIVATFTLKVRAALDCTEAQS